VLRLSDEGRGLLHEIRTVWRGVDQIIEAAIGREKAEPLAPLTRAPRDRLGGHAPRTSDQARDRSAQA
jgi:hypothetical protein